MTTTHMPPAPIPDSELEPWDPQHPTTAAASDLDGWSAPVEKAASEQSQPASSCTPTSSKPGTTPRFSTSFTDRKAEAYHKCTKFGQAKRVDPLASAATQAPCPYPNLEGKRAAKWPGVGKYQIKRSEVMPASHSVRKRTFSARYRETCGTMVGQPAALEKSGGTKLHDFSISPGPANYNVQQTETGTRVWSSKSFPLSTTARFDVNDPHCFYPTPQDGPRVLSTGTSRGPYKRRPASAPAKRSDNSNKAKQQKEEAAPRTVSFAEKPITIDATTMPERPASAPAQRKKGAPTRPSSAPAKRRGGHPQAPPKADTFKALREANRQPRVVHSWMKSPGPVERRAERKMMEEVVADLERTYMQHSPAGGVHYATMRYQVKD